MRKTKVYHFFNKKTKKDHFYGCFTLMWELTAEPEKVFAMNKNKAEKHDFEADPIDNQFCRVKKGYLERKPTPLKGRKKEPTERKN